MSEQGPQLHILRRIGALLAGFFVVVILSTGTDALLHASAIFRPYGQPMSDALFGLATAYRTIYSVLGSYITARLAPDRPMAHALVGGAIGLVLSIVGVVVTWDRGPDFGPKWYPLSLVVLAMPGAWVGGILAVMQLRRRPDLSNVT